MLSLSIFFIVWLVFLGLYGVMSLISMMQMVRYGIAGFGTLLSTVAFLAIGFCIVLGTGWTLIEIDWTQQVNLFGWLGSAPILGQ